MKTNCVDNTNFQGKFLVLGKYDKVPERRINLIRKDIEKIIQPKEYNLYFERVDDKDVVLVACDKDYPFNSKNAGQTKVSIEANTSKFMSVAKKIINDYELSLRPQKKAVINENNKAIKKIEIEVKTSDEKNNVIQPEKIQEKADVLTETSSPFESIAKSFKETFNKIANIFRN